MWSGKFKSVAKQLWKPELIIQYIIVIFYRFSIDVDIPKRDFSWRFFI